MVYVKTFKGYEDKPADMDKQVNDWLTANAHKIKLVRDVKAAMSHETGGRAGMGDLIYTVVYEASEPLA
ncbi:MAG: hypothetical protein HUU46_08995 [Candidatus Hydrogenedentes bacterium]|nr:hypothetical protein [Candidatus Hydrogenedentota bacterium]